MSRVRARLPLPHRTLNPNQPRPLCARFFLPDDLDYIANFWGHVYALTRWYTFDAGTAPGDARGVQVGQLYEKMYDQARLDWLAGGCEPVYQQADLVFTWPGPNMQNWTFQLGDNQVPKGKHDGNWPITSYYQDDTVPTFGLRMERTFGDDYVLHGGIIANVTTRFVNPFEPVYRNPFWVEMWVETPEGVQTRMSSMQSFDGYPGSTVFWGTTSVTEGLHPIAVPVRKVIIDYRVHDHDLFPGINYVDGNAGQLNLIVLHFGYLSSQNPPS